VAQCLANIEGAAANLKSFALQTQDQQAKQMFQQLSQSMDQSAQQLRGRMDYIMQQEPQYAQEIQGTYNISGGTTGTTTLGGTGGTGGTTGQKQKRDRGTSY
jgi:DNA anti-recombination protein RmuC